MVQVPWDFSSAPGPGEETVENLPTEAGRALGAELARLCDAADAQVRAEFPRARPRCDDCAFRFGTRPNGCEETLMDAVKCMVEGQPFYCHKGVRDGTPRSLCAGWAAMTVASNTDLGNDAKLLAAVADEMRQAEAGW